MTRISKIGQPRAVQISKNKRIDNIKRYNENPKLCKQCGTPIPYDKKQWNTFCNTSCAGIYNNFHGKIGNKTNPNIRRCTSCNKKITSIDTTLTLCFKCGKEDRILKQVKEIEERMLSQFEVKLRGAEIKLYLIHTRGYQCEKCHITEWNNSYIQLAGHHIDGNYLHNHPSNLKLLCPNCHSQTDTYCSKNRPKNKRKLYKRRKDKGL